MVQKTHIPRVEDTIDERAAQLLSADPLTPADEQTWLNGTEKKFSIRNGGVTANISVPILDTDPIAPEDGWVWINKPDQMFRWQYLGVIKEIDLALGDDYGYTKSSG